MNKEDLIESAGLLKELNADNLKEFSAKRNELVDIMNRKMLSRPDVAQMVGEANLEMMKDNHANHARFLESIFQNPSPEALVDTILWVFRAYMSRNFASTYWSAQLNAWIGIYKENLSEECFTAVYPFYEWMQIHIPTFTVLAESNIDASNSVH